MYLIMSDCDAEIDRALKIWEEYKKQDAAYNAEKERFEWQTREYENMTGAYTWIRIKYDELLKEDRAWNNCVTWDNADRWKHHDWCVNDFGEGYYHRSGGGEGCSLGFGRGYCTRTPEKARKDAYIFAIEESVKHNYLNAAPPKVVSLPQPIPPNIQIACCLNKVDITNSKLDASQIKQSCKIQQKADTTVNKANEGADETDEEEEEESDNTIMYIVIAIIILMLLCSSSIAFSILGGVIVM
jgi:hypothetical protein